MIKLVKSIKKPIPSSSPRSWLVMSSPIFPALAPGSDGGGRTKINTESAADMHDQKVGKRKLKKPRSCLGIARGFEVGNPEPGHVKRKKKWNHMTDMCDPCNTGNHVTMEHADAIRERMWWDRHIHDQWRTCRLCHFLCSPSLWDHHPVMLPDPKPERSVMTSSHVIHVLIMTSSHVLIVTPSHVLTVTSSVSWMQAVTSPVSYEIICVLSVTSSMSWPHLYRVLTMSSSVS